MVFLLDKIFIQLCGLSRLTEFHVLGTVNNDDSKLVTASMDGIMVWVVILMMLMHSSLAYIRCLFTLCSYPLSVVLLGLGYYFVN